MAKDFYKILGVDRKADQKEIKKAYRKLARQYHPDVNPNNKDAEAKFKEVSEAFQVLSNEEKRKLYDQFGEDWDKVKAGGVPGNAEQGYGVNFSDVFNRGRRARARAGAGVGSAESYGGTSYGGTYVEDVDPQGIDDLLRGIFGGFRGGDFRNSGLDGDDFDLGGMRGRTRGPQKGQDFEQPIDISLAESIHGAQRDLQLTIHDPATGAVEQRNVTVKIPAGVREGARVRAAGQGADGTEGGPRGDLYLKVHIQPHPFWKRDGDDLRCEVPVTLTEAALGATIDVPTINGPVQMKIPAGTQCDQTFRLSGRGVPHLKGGGAGDQYVKVKVIVPKDLTPRERELLEELSRLRNEDVRGTLPKGL